MKTTKLYADEGRRADKLLRKHVGYSGRSFSKGAYARVFWSPKLRRVIKVGKLDDPYLQYINLIKREKSSLVPKIDKVIYSYHFDGVDEDGAYAVIMERLYHAKTLRQRAIRDLIIEAIDTEGCVPLELVSRANPRPALIKDIMRMTKRITAKMDSSTVNLDLDMHNDNIMFRANGQAVITDPYA